MVSENENVRAVGFESFQREHPNVKRLASLWRSDPKYAAWMELYTKDDNTTLEYFEEDNHQIGTFYRALTEAEIRAAERAQVDALAAEMEGAVGTNNTPAYEVLGIVHEHGTSEDEQEHRIWLVKLGRPRWVAADQRYAWVEYVHVDQFRTTFTDDQNITHIDVKTRVTVTDEDSEAYDTIEPIYVAPAFLGVQECMWAIGEYPIVDKTITEE